MAYEVLTVGKLKRMLTALGKEFDGDNTPIYTGDFEGNYLHGKHEIMKDNEHRAIFLGYEMHESIEEW